MAKTVLIYLCISCVAQRMPDITRTSDKYMQWQAIISEIFFKLNKDSKSLQEQSLIFTPANVLKVRVERYINNWSVGIRSCGCQVKK